MSGVESMMASSSLSESSKMTTDSTGATTVTKEASGHSSGTAAKDGVVTDHKSSSFNTGPQTTTVSGSALASRKAQGEAVVVAGVNITEVTDDFKLNQLLDSCDEYEDRRKIRMRLKALVAEKKGLREELSGHDQSRGSRSQTSTAHSRFEAMSKSATSNTKDSDLRSSEGDSKTSSTVSPFGVSRTSNTESRSSSQVNVQKSSYSSSSSSYKTSSSMSKVDSKKVVSPFDKFKQMDSQTPRTPNPFSLALPIIRHNAATIKKIILDFCKRSTAEYESKVELDHKVPSVLLDRTSPLSAVPPLLVFGKILLKWMDYVAY